MSIVSLTPSAEQLIIIQSLKFKQNILTEAVAGSGKTTTALLMATMNPKLSFMLVTYSSSLKTETRNKVSSSGIDNLIIESYHSLFHNNFTHGKCSMDHELDMLLITNAEPITKTLKHIDVLIVDEVQDINPLRHKALKHAYKFMTKVPPFYLFGDRHQCIFDYMGSHPVSVIRANEIFNFNDYPWGRCSLTISYRCPPIITNYINKCLLGTEYMKPYKTNGPRDEIVYITDIGRTANYIKGLIHGNHYLPSEIMVLAASVKSSSNRSLKITDLENKVSKLGIPTYSWKDDERCPNSAESNGKVRFMTRHASKGLEAKVVILMTHYNIAYTHYDTEASPDICTCPIYVEASRSMEKLVLCFGPKSNIFEFTPRDAFKEICKPLSNDDFKCLPSLLKIPKRRDGREISSKPITHMVGRASHNTIELVESCINIEQASEPGEELNIPLNIRCNHGLESVSSIVGTMLPIMYADKIANYGSIVSTVCNTFETSRSKDKELKGFVKGIVNKSVDARTTSDYIKIAMAQMTNEDRRLARIRQIERYDFVKDDISNLAMDRMRKLGLTVEGKDAKIGFEVSSAAVHGGDDRICGIADCVDWKNNTIYEFKCVTYLTHTHMLQLIVYMRLFNMPNGVLYNIRNDHKYVVKCKDMDILDKVVDSLLEDNRVVSKGSEEDFIAMI